MTKTKPMTDEYTKEIMRLVEANITATIDPYDNDGEPMLEIESSLEKSVQNIIDQATSKAREEERNKLRQSVELWMDTHERNQTTFTTDNFIKFVTEEL